MTSYRVLNQIFYKHNKFDNPLNIVSLKPFFMNLCEDLKHKSPENPLHDKNISPCTYNSLTSIVIETTDKILEKSSTPIITKNNEKVQSFFDPKDKDSLFWCIYTFIHGESDFIMIRNNYGNRKLEEKMKVYSFLKTDKKIAKQNRYKITNQQVQEMMSELMCVQSETSFLVLIALSLFYNIRILLVDTNKNMYLEFDSINSDEEPKKTCVLYKVENKGYSRYRLLLNDYEPSMTSHMFCLEHYYKPLKSVSNYKLSELIPIAEQFGLWNENTNKMKKNELYEHLSEYCAWK